MKSNLIILCLAVVLINAAGKSFGQNADLSIIKSDGVPTVTAGDGIIRTYTITVTNNGPSQANNVSVTDAWPLGFTQGGMTMTLGTTNAQGGNFIWTIGTMAIGGVATLTVSYTVPSSTQAGSQTNTATVTSNEPDPTPGNNTAIDINTVVTSADLSITKSDGITTVTAGDGVVRTYTITVINNGLSQADNVSVTDTWPAGFTQGTLPGNVTPGSGGNFTWDVGTVAPGATLTLTVSYTVPSSTQGGTQTNTATLTSSDPDPAPGNNTATDTNTVIVPVPPTITCPGNVTVSVNQSDLNNCYANVSFTGDHAINITGSPSPNISYTFTSNTGAGGFGSALPTSLSLTPGVNTISLAATNSEGTSSCSFTVTVLDLIPPVIISCPSNITISAASFQCTASPGGFISARDNCGGIIITRASASVFPVGVSVQTFTATDASGNTATCSRTVTVTDNERPTFIQCGLSLIEVFTGPGATNCSAYVSEEQLGTPIMNDNCPGTVTLSRDNVPPGNIFPFGATVILNWATDAAGNRSEIPCTQVVIVKDNTPPVINNCPADVTVYTSQSPTSCGQQAIWTLPTATDNCGGSISQVRNRDPGDVFPLGQTLVFNEFYDGEGNRSVCRFNVTVIDDTPPVITGCPANITVTAAPNSCSQIVAWTEPTAADVCTSGQRVSRSHAPGSSFNVGVTTITYVFADGAGNRSTCSFNVTVIDDQPPTINAISANPVILWPPNHKMKDVTVNYTSNDNCGVVTCRLEVSSNEPINGTGDGDTDPDWEIIDDHHVKLRAERAANGDGRIYTITIICSDEQGNETRQTATVRVAHNITSPGSGQSFKIGSTVSFAGTFWDKPGNKHTAKWLIDGSATTGTVTEPSGNKNGKVTGSYKFNSPGVYKLQMNVTDQNGITSYANTSGDLEAIVVIYDPNGGYTYGGGFYNSSAGALVSNPSSTGKASYGFAMNYFKNSTNPKGETQFEFKIGDFEFNALNFDYLVISNSMAQFKGTGKIIGGQSGIGFTMTVTDGQLDGSGIDKIRMKIYNKNNGKIIYDNQPGASDAALPIHAVGSNSIVVISGTNSSLTSANTNQKAEMEASTAEVSNGLDVIAFPNPSASSFTINVKANSAKEKITMQVVDMYGRIIETRNVSTNSIVKFGEHYKSGTYFARIIQGKEHKEIKLIKLID